MNPAVLITTVTGTTRGTGTTRVVRPAGGVTGMTLAMRTPVQGAGTSVPVETTMPEAGVTRMTMVVDRETRMTATTGMRVLVIGRVRMRGMRVHAIRMVHGVETRSAQANMPALPTSSTTVR